ncbi:ergothioneine biosynthesis protein EgtB [Methylocystis echinoides]|uniref:ergothioneine biosynthesis protein EgtB n=1 Tax=Methylocystis echinoides TaxID=29468 RepID=UPI00342560BF
MVAAALAPGRPLADARPLGARLFETRRLSLEIAAPLSAEDMTVQAMDDASPTKWHLAHTSWFFETFILAAHDPRYTPFDEAFAYCFNSYYERLGARQPRPKRGLLTWPPLDRVLAYRDHVDRALDKLLAEQDPTPWRRLIEVGINHEQQHQELMLTDILALFAANPLRPAYREAPPRARREAREPMRWIDFPGGVFPVGHAGDGFAFDNEGPRHDALIHPFRLADRLVTNGEWLAFMADGGYETPTLWLSDGWTTVERENWRAPLYWERRDGAWLQMSLHGLQPLDDDAPVAHVSYYEADAFARWAGKRLPTEFEWEVAAATAPQEGNSLATGALRPLPAGPSNGAPRQMFGDVWEWTQSAYLPYPGYRPPKGALGEYNGKFMVSQHVLRGGSCATPRGHARATYRNFFYPHQRWQFLGLRLASEAA